MRFVYQELSFLQLIRHPREQHTGNQTSGRVIRTRFSATKEYQKRELFATLFADPNSMSCLLCFKKLDMVIKPSQGPKECVYRRQVFRRRLIFETQTPSGRQWKVTRAFQCELTTNRIEKSEPLTVHVSKTT
jgi:hypothetical protein